MRRRYNRAEGVNFHVFLQLHTPRAKGLALPTSIFRVIAFIAFALVVFIASVADAQTLTAVQSRKTHAANGTHDLRIDTTQPIGGAITVDPRAIGSGHTIVFQFSSAAIAPVTVTAVDPQAVNIGSASIIPPTVASEVSVNLAGIPNNSRVTISLRDGAGSAYASVSVGFLQGDVNNNRAVDSNDISAVKARSGLSASATNFLFDVGTSGSVNVSDISTVKSRVGQTLAPTGQAMLTIAKAGTGSGSMSGSGTLTTMGVPQPKVIACTVACQSSFALFDVNTPITLTATPSAGSVFSGWAGLCASGSVSLVASSICIASFTANVYSVTPSASPNGSISPPSVQMANHGSSLSFSVTPAANFTASVGGSCSGSLIGSTYTTNPITGPCTVNATFAPSTYPVTPSAGPDGSISPPGIQNIANGATTTFTVTANANFTASVGGTCGGNLVGNTYTTSPVIGACTVIASFVRSMYNVTPSAGAGGSISPSGVQSVLAGATASFAVTPLAGFAAVMGGTCGGNLVGTIYTTNAITGLCAVVASFVANTAKYVSTTGSDTTGDGSIANPWKTIGKGIATMAGGDTLIVRNGLYSGKPNFITNVKSGTVSRYTVIMAESPMDVRIQSTTSLQYSDNQLYLSGNYIKVDGFIFDIAGSVYPPYVGEIDGNYNKVTRSIFKRSGDIDAYGGLLALNGNDNLVEDTAGVGACRYCFKQGGTDQVTQRNIWRRVVARFDYSNSSQLKATFSTYGNDSVATNGVFDHLYQNVIAIDGQYPGTNGGEEKYGGIYFIKASTNVRMFGSMVLNEGVGYSGLHLRDYSNGNANFASHSVVWNLTGSQSFAIGITATGADHLTIGGIIPAAAFDLDNGPPIASLLKPVVPPANLLNNTPGAVIMKRYGVTGTRWGEPGYDQLTTENLWPWLYQDKIKAIFREVNNVPAGNKPATNNTLRGFAATGNGGRYKV